MAYVINDEARLSDFDRLAMGGEDVRIPPCPVAARLDRPLRGRLERFFVATFECFEIGPDLLTATCAPTRMPYFDHPLWEK